MISARRFKYGRSEQRAVLPGGTDWSGLYMTGAVPPHGWDNVSKAGVPVTQKTVLGISTVQRCLLILRSAFDQMGPPRAYREASDKDNLPYQQYISKSDRQYPNLLTNPWGTSPWGDNVPITFENGMAKTLVSLALWGKTWWHTDSFDFYGNPSSLSVLHPDFVKVKGNERKISEVVYQQAGQITELDPADLTLIERLPIPGQQAVDPLRSLSGLWAIAIAASQYSQTWFANGATNSYLLSTDEKIGEDETRRIALKLMLEHSGLQAAHTPLVLDAGLKPQMLSQNPNESQMNETLLFVREEIAGYMGFPAHLVGTTGDSGGVWGKGIVEMNYSMVDFTFGAYINPIEAAFTNLIPRGQMAELNTGALLRANALDASKAALSYRTGAVSTPNEERRDRGLPPIEGGDSILTAINTSPVVAQESQFPGSDAPPDEGAAA
jgi:HK97 family phage portal protein